MQICKDIEDFRTGSFTVFTMGTFDGVHLGHRKILARLQQSATRTDGESVVMVFDPPPRMVLHPEFQNLKILTTPEEKAFLISQTGIDRLIIFPFTKEFSEMDAGTFVRTILVEKLHARSFIIGYDHRFGKDREGGPEQLHEMAVKYGFALEIIPEQDVKNIAVSSTKIRSALNLGEVAKANAFLGYEYSLSGKVVKGDRIGRTLGFPTANIGHYDPRKLVPANGVYAVRVFLEERSYKGMMNIGVRPTLNETKLTMEVNIFDFEEDIYGKEIRVSFVEWLREEKKFPGLSSLIKEMEKDMTRVLEIFSH